MITTQIGKKIADYRKANKITIREFSEKTSLSQALISQLERGIGNPTLSALIAIADVMDISLSLLFSEEVPNDALIMRRDQRIAKKVPQGYSDIYDVLTTSPLTTSMELLLASLKPHSQSNKELSVHGKMEEIAFILNGEVVINIDNERFLLHTGDSIRILPGRKHNFYNETDEEAQILLVQNKLMY